MTLPQSRPPGGKGGEHDVSAAKATRAPFTSRAQQSVFVPVVVMGPHSQLKGKLAVLRKRCFPSWAGRQVSKLTAFGVLAMALERTLDDGFGSYAEESPLLAALYDCVYHQQ